MTIARASDRTYMDNSRLDYQSHFGIDLWINPEAPCALELEKDIRNLRRVAVENLSNAMIEAQEVALKASGQLMAKTLWEIQLDSGLESRVPLGEIKTIVDLSTVVDAQRNRLAPEFDQLMHDVTFSAGETTIALIKLLLSGRCNLRVIENDLKNVTNSRSNFEKPQ
jgi:hypothetical protein